MYVYGQIKKNVKMYKKGVPNNNDDKETPVPQNNLTAGKNTENKTGLYIIIYYIRYRDMEKIEQ